MGAAASGGIGVPSELWQCGMQENCCAGAAERGYVVVDVNSTEQEAADYGHIVESYHSGKEATHEFGKVVSPHAVSSMGQCPEAYPTHQSRAALPGAEMVQPLVPQGCIVAVPSFEAQPNFAGFRTGVHGAPRCEFATEHFSNGMHARAQSVPRSTSQGRAELRASSCGRPSVLAGPGSSWPQQPAQQASWQQPLSRPSVPMTSPACDSLLMPPPGATRGRAAGWNGREAPPGVGGSATFSVGGGSAAFSVGPSSSRTRSLDQSEMQHRGRCTSMERCSPSGLQQHAVTAQMQGLPHPPQPQVPFSSAAESGARGSAGMSDYLGSLVQTFMSGIPATRSDETSGSKKIKELPEEVDAASSAVNSRRQEQPEAEPELEHLAQEPVRTLGASHQQILTPRQLLLSASRQRCPSFTSFGADELMQPGASLVALPGGIVEAGLFKQKSFLESSREDSLGESGKVQQLLDTKWSTHFGKDENYSPQQVHRGLRHAWAGDMTVQDSAGRPPLTSASGPTSPQMGMKGSASHGCSWNLPIGSSASMQAAGGLPLVMHVD